LTKHKLQSIFVILVIGLCWSWQLSYESH